MEAAGASLESFFAHGDSAPTHDDVAWYRDRLRAVDGLVLAAPAGTGRLLAPLARAGLRLHGVERSSAAMERCRRTLGAGGASAAVELFRQDIAALNLPFRYAAALMAEGGFQRLAEPRAAFDALARVRAHLLEGATLYIELFTPSAAVHTPGAPVVEVERVVLDDGSHVVRRAETHTDPESRCQTIASRYEHRAGHALIGREDTARRIVWYDEPGIASLLEDAGFAQVQIGPFGTTGPGPQRWMASARA